MNEIARKLLGLGLAVGAVAGPVLLTAPPAEAGAITCTAGVLDASPRETVNCYTDIVGYCTFYYDPVEVFPNGTVTETVNYVHCLTE